MNKEEIKRFLENIANKKERTIVIIDYGNVEKWKNSLGWQIGIKELANLVKNFSYGKQFLRRFYYGADYGANDKAEKIIDWSRLILEKADMNRFEVVKKRVKYIHNTNNKYGFDKKCDLDVEMAVDLIKERENYDTIIIFSGDGDLMYAIKYLKEIYQKSCIVFGARNHVGREIYDAKKEKIIDDILYAEDFEYRLNRNRFQN
ncbi:MAG: hypothetical protein A2312_02855 [Candidatus Staskawiczbacteria bacterium RIFOXYB2_FULL_32_9]|uniref:NYN domain-containing protein n=1 Tax=Candidatus Staskawiczbacteria bacterium RIFOXYD1_FULL_32_13 TaxID=1802234 RepID=A0A1G2JQG4_9BACT|nr:MAG: hypothetical protein UR22_C0008G0015 [Parcubacteria group bacterium GW2011_GWC2_32_10]OGZ77524.1 MAG: hypothetical protein A2256_04040 [Candidatus Staskawiczbacteria bacterium RIFOXYA2_FULL_32_7]OGZ81097.1 MAG: hypothetical protein A2360_00695 [Candidatus Staskawiczbacteria bacterium RIFOXYB1_FULL_32_11]OGZ83637.1 MAG: hypothetical protein A2312_02855 [Candidatus Staskawiczbacteria bacterium RIFOXYB2_FULL_32_9]OGZ86397.1 MAG: hypothetical protein A2463_03695 [Candidatus Staskawiczbacter